MINIHETISKFLNDVSSFKAELSTIMDTINQKTQQLSNDRVSLEQDKQELTSRETAVSEIENIVAIEDSAQKTLADAKTQMSALIQAKDAFENYKNETLASLKKQADELTEKGKYIKKEYETLNAMKKQLEADKASYKEKIATSIVDLANKK